MKKRILVLLSALLLVFCLTVIPAYADLGGYSGDSDYGSDWDSGDSWSSNDDWYDSSNYDGHYYSGSSSYYDDGFDFEDILVFIFLIIIVVAVMNSKKKREGNRQPVNAGGTFTSGLRPMSEYTSLDPAFDQQAFTEKLSNLYVKMQNGWMDKDIEPLRPYFTDALFTQMERQLNAYKTKGHTNYVERIAVLSVTPRGFKQSGGEDHIYVELQARIVDYTLEDATGQLISGDKNREKFMTYEWDVSRASGETTQEETGEEQRIICPACGAPLDINASARCPYCDTVITRQQKDWALCAIKGISQKTN